jgi:Uncharacterized conserved protein
MVHFEPPHFIFNYIPTSRPVLKSIRGGTSFWVTAGRAGVRSSVLTVPVTFPPEDVPNGEMLSGLPLPDIRRTMGTFYYFGTDLSRYEEGNTEFGGILKRLVSRATPRRRSSSARRIRSSGSNCARFTRADRSARSTRRRWPSSRRARM